MIISWHRDEIKRRRSCGWRREEVKKVCNANGETFGKQLCIGKKNQLLNEYYLLKQRMTLIKQQEKRREKGVIFAKTKGIKNPLLIQYLVEEVWGMGPKRFPCLLKQLRNVVVGYGVEKDIMDTMITVPDTDESGEKVHVSVIDSLKVATKLFTPERIYDIHTSRPDTYNVGKFEPTYEEGSKGLAYSTRIYVLMKGCTNLCGNDKVY